MDHARFSYYATAYPLLKRGALHLVHCAGLHARRFAVMTSTRPHHATSACSSFSADYFLCSSFTLTVIGWPSRSTFTSTTCPTLLRRSASVKS